MNSQSNMNQNSIHKKNPFTVPEGYFETFSDKVMRQINETPVSPKEIKRNLFLRHPFAIAASIVGFLLISYTVVHFLIYKPAEKYKQLAQQADIEEIILPLVDENEIAEAFDYTANASLDGDDIENYLLNKNIHEKAISNYINK